MSAKSVRETPSAGSSKSADPPPETKKSTVSFSVRPWIMNRARRVASKLRCSRTGCAASKISSGPMGPIECPSLVMTQPREIRVPKSP